MLSVVAFHAFPDWLKGGFMGVDVFFVISGFLISTIIFENLDNGTFSFSEFYVRRIKRIFPALLIVLTVMLVFGWFGLLADEYRQHAKHTMAGIGFVANFVLWGEAGYFDNLSETKHLLHLWSLGIEEQFYVLWPALCWTLWKLKIPIKIVLMVLTIGSFFLNVTAVASDGVEAFYSPLTRFWELLFGAILAHLSLRNKTVLEKVNQNNIISNGLSLVGLIFLICGFMFIQKIDPIPGYWALIPVIGATLVILSGPASLINRLLLANKFAVFFGLISYPLYLWHWPVLTILRIEERNTPDTIHRLLAIFLSVILAWLTYYLIERKVRYLKGSISVAFLIALSAVIFGSAFLIYIQNGMPERKAVTTSEFSEKVQYQFMGPFWKYSKNDLCLNEYPYKNQDNLAWWFCIKSSKNPPTILLLGSSYANQLYPGFSKNQKLSHHSVLSIGACRVGSDGTGVALRNPCYGASVKKQDDFIDGIVNGTPSLKFVILDGLERKPSPAYIDRVLVRIKFLEKQGLQVIVFTPHIIPDFHPKACFRSPFNHIPKDCSFPSIERQRILDDFNPLVMALNASTLNVLVFDQNDVFCDRNDGKCSFVREGLPLHRDDGHTSEYASILLQDYFTKWAQETLPSILEPSYINRP